MNIATVKLTSLIVSGIASSNYVKRTESWEQGFNSEQYVLFYFYFVQNVFDLLYWWFLIYKGTSPGVFFTKCKMACFSLFMIVDVVCTYIRSVYFIEKHK